jgi:selenocysteine lyase/cysteine desulfurase
MRDRGGCITLNLFDRDGRFVDHRVVEHLATEEGISLRAGCFCNPGGGELALGISSGELTSCFIKNRQRMTHDDFRRCIDDKSTGAVRVSVGLASNFADVHRFIQFARRFLDRAAGDLEPGE